MITVAKAPLLFRNKEEIEARANYFASLRVAKDGLAGIVGGYRFAPDDAMFCGLNGCNRKHQRGYVIATVDGRETHCGSFCGRREFDVLFKDMENRFETGLRHANRRELIISLQSNAAEHTQRVQLIENQFRPIYKKIKAIRGLFRGDGVINRVLENLMRSDGEIRIRRKRSAIEREMNDRPQRDDLETIGRIKGISALATYARMANTLDNDVTQVIREVQEADADNLPQRKVDILANRIGNVDRTLIHVESFLVEARLLLNRSNLDEFTKIQFIDGVSMRKLEPMLAQVKRELDIS